MPDWWLQATGVAAIFIILMCFVVTIAAFYMVIVLADLKRNVNTISQKIQKLTERVDGIAKSVQEVTTEVGSRTSGIVRTVDDIASGAFDVIEKYAPIAIGAAIIFKLKQLFDRKN